MLSRTPEFWFRVCATRPGFPVHRSIPCARCRRIAATMEKVCFWISYRRAAPVATCFLSSRAPDQSDSGSVLVKFGGTSKSFDVVPIFLWLFLAHFVFCFFQVFHRPIRAVLVHRRFELAYLLRCGLELELGDTLNVDEIVCLLRRRIEEVHFRNFVRLQPLLQPLVG